MEKRYRVNCKKCTRTFRRSSPHSFCCSKCKLSTKILSGHYVTKYERERRDVTKAVKKIRETYQKKKPPKIIKIHEQPTEKQIVDRNYSRVHRWVKKNFIKSDICEKCGSSNDLDWSNKDHKYSLNRFDWQVLCRGCHSRFDFANGLIRSNRLKIKK